MHNAPSVSFPVGRSHFQGRLLASLVCLGLLTLASWSFQSKILGWRHGLAACSLVLISVWVAWSWWRTHIGSFSWDGVAWHLAVGTRSALVLPEIVLDLQSAVLLRLQVVDGKGVAWVWLDRVSSPVRWMALRRAVYGRTRLEGDPLADPANTPLTSQLR